MKKTKIVVTQKENEPEVPVEIIAQSIQEIATKWRQIRRSQLNEHALIILLHHATKIPQVYIRVLLNNLDNLEKLYLKK